MTAFNCGNCGHWCQDYVFGGEGDARVGLCTYDPPRAVTGYDLDAEEQRNGDNSAIAVWPFVQAGMRCGKWASPYFLATIMQRKAEPEPDA